MALLKAILLDGPQPGAEVTVESRLTHTVEGFRDRPPFVIEQWYGVEGGLEVIEYTLVVPSPRPGKNCYKVKRS